MDIKQKRILAYIYISDIINKKYNIRNKQILLKINQEKKDLKAKIFKSNATGLKSILNKYRNDINISEKRLIKYIIQNNEFKKSLNPKFRYTIHNNLLTNKLNEILKKKYHDNKSNKSFQDLITYIDNLLKNYQTKKLNNDLREWLIYKYKIQNFNESYNIDRKKEHKNLQENILQLNTVIELFKDFKSLQKLLQDKSLKRKVKFPNKTIIHKILNHPLGKYLKQHPEYIEIINDNKLYKQKKELVNDYKNSMYLLEYGINYSDKTDQKDRLFMNALKFNPSDYVKQKNMDYVYFYVHKRNKNKWYNVFYNNPSIEIIRIIENNKRLRSNKPYICFVYKYHYSENKINQLYAKTILHYYQKQIYENKDYFNELVDLSFEFNYKDKFNKTKAYNRYLHKLHYLKYSHRPAIKEIPFMVDPETNKKMINIRDFDFTFRRHLKYYQIFYPNYKNNRFLYCSFGHPCLKEVDSKKKDKQLLQYFDKSFFDKIDDYMIKSKKMIKTLGNLDSKNTDTKELNQDFVIIMKIITHLNNKLFKNHYKQSNKVIVNKFIKTTLNNEILNKHLINYIDAITQNAQKMRDSIEQNDKTIKIVKYLNNVIKFSKTLNTTIKSNKPQLNRYMIKIISDDISKFLDSQLFRLVDTKRSKNELIKLALQNLDNKVIKTLVDTYEFKKLNVEYKNKFDEILDTSNKYEKIKLTKEISINLNDLINCCLTIMKHRKIKFIENILNDIWDLLINKHKLHMIEIDYLNK